MIRHSEFDISVNGRTLPCLLAEPGRDTATADPALFVYLVIGNRDNRVGTECCTRFALSLFETELRLGRETSAGHLYIDSQAVGHRVSDGWRRRADQFLLNRARGDALPNTDRFTAQIEAQP